MKKMKWVQAKGYKLNEKEKLSLSPILYAKENSLLTYTRLGIFSF